MSTSLPFTGSSFSILSLSQVTSKSVRLTYTQDPLAVSSTGTNDALNKANYSINGPSQNSIESINTVIGNPQQVVLNFTNPLNAGIWTINVSNVQTTTANPLVPNPQSANFLAEIITEQPNLSQGAVTQSAFEILKKWLPAKYKNKKNWDALTEAISRGDSYLQTLSRAVYEQLFVSTATGKYLDQRGGDEGFFRPKRIGVKDSSFRQLIIDIKNSKITLQSFLQVLKSFYSNEQTRANVTSGLAQPFNISEGEELILKMDGKKFTVIFEQNDFSIPNAATALEVCNVFNKIFYKNNLDAFAETYRDRTTGSVKVRLFSGALGLKGRIQILGGKTQNVFQFSEKLPTTQAASTQWTVLNLSPTLARFSFVGGTNPTLFLLNEGDYVNVYGSVFNPTNQGSHYVTKVGLNYFEVNILNAINETVTQTSANDILFFTPKINVLNDNKNISFAAQTSEETDVFLPVTTQIIERKKDTATYFYEDSSEARRISVTDSKYTVTYVESTVLGQATLKIGAHSFVTGEKVLFYPTFIYDLATNSVIEQGEYTIVSTAGSGVITISGLANTATFFYTGQPYYVTGNYKNSTGNSVLTLQDASVLSVGDSLINENLTVDMPAETVNKTKAYSLDQNLIYEYPPEAVKMSDDEIYLFGGATTGPVDRAEVYCINVANKTYTPKTSMPVGTSSHTVLKINEDKILILGGRADPTQATFYSKSLDSYTNFLTLDEGRRYAKAVLLPNNKVLIYGGNQTGLNPSLLDLSNSTCSPINVSVGNPDGHLLLINNDGQALAVGGGSAECYLYECWTNTFTKVQDYPSVAEIYNSAGIYWDGIGTNGGFFVAGGINSGSVISDVSYFDTQTLTWTSLAPLPTAIQSGCLYPISKEEIAIFGGYETESAPFPCNQWVYIYNKTTNTWRQGDNLFSENSLVPAPSFKAGERYFAFSHKTLFMIDKSIQKPFSGKLNNFCQINAKYSSKQISTTSENLQEFSTTTPISYWVLTNENVYENGLVHRFKQIGNAKNGYYWLDKQFPISKLSANTAQVIDERSTITTLLTSSLPAEFPESGFIVIGYGTIYQTGPIKYLQKIGSNSLTIDPDYVFDKNIPAGISVLYAYSKEPSDFIGFPSVYLTDSISPRIYAENLIDGIKATGSKITKTILYPDTKGLGNSQIDPLVTGKPKLNDAVYIWGTQDYLNKKRER